MSTVSPDQAPAWEQFYRTVWPHCEPTVNAWADEAWAAAQNNPDAAPPRHVNALSGEPVVIASRLFRNLYPGVDVYVRILADGEFTVQMQACSGLVAPPPAGGLADRITIAEALAQYGKGGPLARPLPYDLPNRTNIARACRRGVIRAERVGTAWLMDRRDFERYLYTLSGRRAAAQKRRKAD